MIDERVHNPDEQQLFENLHIYLPIVIINKQLSKFSCCKNILF